MKRTMVFVSSSSEISTQVRSSQSVAGNSISVTGDFEDA